MTFSFERCDLGPRSDLDRWSFFDPTHQVSGHAHREAVGPDEQVDPSTRTREEYRRLTSGVGTSDDDDLIAVPKLRFLHKRSVVVDAGTFKFIFINRRRHTISGSCGD